MAVIQATLTKAALEVFARYLIGDCSVPQVGALLPFQVLSFAVGEGGWKATAGGFVPRDPDPLLTDLDCVVHPSRYATDQRASFSKNLTYGVDMALTFHPTSITFAATCTLDLGEFNDDGNGNFPEIWEIGLFGSHPITGDTFMICYGTFAGQTKTPAGALTNVVKVQLQLG